jgi:hypothetical protein
LALVVELGCSLESPIAFDAVSVDVVIEPSVTLTVGVASASDSAAVAPSSMRMSADVASSPLVFSSVGDFTSSSSSSSESVELVTDASSSSSSSFS